MDAVWILGVTAMSVAIAVLNAGAEHGFHTIGKHLVFMLVPRRPERAFSH
jgi:hypothetical protein